MTKSFYDKSFVYRRTRRSAVGVKTWLAVFAVLLVVAGCSVSLAGEPGIAELPVQHDGRVKPIDTFARVLLLSVYGKRSLPDMSALDWYFEVAADKPAFRTRPIFHLRNPELVYALQLPERKKRLYTFEELSEATLKHRDYLHELYQKEYEQRSLIERQLVETYIGQLRVDEVRRSFSCLLAVFKIQNPELAAEFDLQPNQAASYYYFAQRSDVLEKVIDSIRSKEEEEWNARDLEIVQLVNALNRVRQDLSANGAAVVPARADSPTGEWRSPWALMNSPKLSNEERQTLDTWAAILEAESNGRRDSANGKVAELFETFAANRGGVAMDSRLRLETWMSRTELFYKSVAAYIAGFLVLGASWLVWPNFLRRCSLALLILGVSLHGGGLLVRMLVMGRPPVSTLYESVIFVGFIGALTGLIVELVRHDGFGLIVGNVMGAVLHFVGFSYAADGDTMGMLVAVLDSNFWLATHVVTITIGYGCALVAGLVGHVYLFRAALPGDHRKVLSALSRNMNGLNLVALFFTLFGTILGGIWADQSWGRFWGWDPKENGALLIVMWQLMLIHGRLAGYTGPRGMAAGLILNNIVVALAWFGVNLLNVGLHSYGFTDSVAMKLAAFCLLEIALASGGYFLARRRAASPA